jgi:hypothetical protein
LSDPFVFHELADSAFASPAVVRLLVGAAGGVLLLAGARVYRSAIGLAAFGAGAIVTLALMLALGEAIPELRQPTVVGVGSLVGGGLGIVLGRLAHRLALAAVGGLAGATLGVALYAAIGPLLGADGATPWWILLIGAVVGALTMPAIFASLLKLVTPAVGAVLVAWALGMPSHALLLLGLWCLGVAVQLASGRRAPRSRGSADAGAE